MRRDVEDPSPFQERVNVNLFFSGAQRRKLLEEVKKAIFSAVPVITITGDEGSGKTMISRMVEKELPADYSCVYLPTTLESFDDVVRILALGLGTENSNNPGSSNDLVAEITSHLNENGRKLVAIFDQSERMYLATLERIRKMLDQINASEVLFQIVLVGRKLLLENLQQLAICNFNTVQERQFSLVPLGLSETYAYLNHCVPQRSPGRGKNVFSPEAAKKIYTMAQGNLRMTNMLAEKSLESFDSETSFMVLLENVCDDGGEAVAKSERNRKGAPLGFGRNTWLAGAGAFLFVVAFFLLVTGEDKKGGPELEKKERSKVAGVVSTDTNRVGEEAGDYKRKPISQTVIVEKEEIAGGLEKGNSAVVLLDPPKVQQETKAIENQVKAPSGQEEKLNLATAEGNVETTKQQDSKAIGIVEKTDENLQAEDTTREKTTTIIIDKVVVNQTGADLQKDTGVLDNADSGIVQAGSVESGSEISEVVTVPENVTDQNIEAVGKEERISDDSESLVNAQSPLEQDTEGELSGGTERERVIPEPVGEVPIILAGVKKHKSPRKKIKTSAKKIIKIAPVTVTLPPLETRNYHEKGEDTKTFDQLYQQRLSATSNWIAGNSNEKHTVQLMVLTSEQAEENLRKRFEQEEYRDISDQLYIIKNNAESSVYVYYGEYPDPDSARKARNTLPVFLRKHSPYAISVENAVKKATLQ